MDLRKRKFYNESNTNVLNVLQSGIHGLQKTLSKLNYLFTNILT